MSAETFSLNSKKNRALIMAIEMGNITKAKAPSPSRIILTKSKKATEPIPGIAVIKSRVLNNDAKFGSELFF